MLLAECLARITNDQLQRMARQAGIGLQGQRREIETALMARLAEPDRLTAMVNNLGPDEWQALKVVFWGNGGQGVTVELCHQVVNLMAGRRRQGPALALVHLMDCGLVYTRKAGYREVYFIPSELQASLADLMARRMAEHVVALNGIPHEEDPAIPDLVEELYRLLAYVFKQEIPLTQSGVIFKRHLRILGQLLGSEPAGGNEDDLLSGRYPEPLGFLIGFALEVQLLKREAGFLRPGGGFAAWLQRPEGEQRVALFQYWKDRYHHPDLQSFLQLSHSIGSAWIKVAAAAAELEPILHPSQRGQLPARLHHHLVHFLAPLHVYQVAFRDGQDLVCRLTETGRNLLAGRPSTTPEPAGPAVYQFILQPTGELIAPRPVPLTVLWHLEMLAGLRQRGPALVYEVNRDTIYQALRAGLDNESLLDFLARHSRTGVPQNLAFEIAAWGRAYGQVYFQEACLLRCADPHLATQIKTGRRTARYVRGEVSPTALIIDRQDYEPLLQALLAEGLLPRPGIAASVPATERLPPVFPIV